MNIKENEETNKRPRSPSSEGSSKGSTGTLVDYEKDMDTESDEIDMQTLLEESLANMANTIDTVDTGVKSTSKEAGEEEKEEAGEKEVKNYEQTKTLLTEFSEVKNENIKGIFESSKPILDYLQSCSEQYFNDIKLLGSRVGEAYQEAEKTYNNVEEYYQFLKEKGLVAASNAYDLYLKSNIEDTTKTALGLDDNTIIREHEKMAFIALQELIYETKAIILDGTQDQNDIKTLIENSLNNEEVEEKKQQLKTHVELAAKTLFFFKHGKSVVDSLSIVQSSGTSYFVPRNNIDLLTTDRNTQLKENVNQLLNGNEYLPFLIALAQDFVDDPTNPNQNDSKYYGSTNVESFFIGRFDLIQHDFDFAIDILETRSRFYEQRVSTGNSIEGYRLKLEKIKDGFEKSVEEDTDVFKDHAENGFKKFEYSGSEEDIGDLSNKIYNKIGEVKKNVNVKVEVIKGIIEDMVKKAEEYEKEIMTKKAQRTISSRSRPAATSSSLGGSKKGIKGKKTFSKKKTMGKFKKKGKRGKTEKRKKNTIKRRPYMNKKKLSIKK
tara:strand:- start:2150 stop:3796 length:1647 start_codon:yes stop_codon:yes gene_type:complete